MAHRTREELIAGLAHVRAAPVDPGVLALVVARPGRGARVELERAELDPEVGLVGDDWAVRGSRHTPDGAAEPDRQLTLMNVRVADLLATTSADRALAGDQLYVDLDLSHTHLPAGTHLTIGSAVVEITSAPHLGCAKFADRFGREAMRLVNSDEGRALRLRGCNARVLAGGTVAVGDTVTRSGAG